MVDFGISDSGEPSNTHPLKCKEYNTWLGTINGTHVAIFSLVKRAAWGPGELNLGMR
jgi:hypothetical protein